MNARVKKVMVKIRKEQESQIKQTLFKQKTKKELVTKDYLPIAIPRECEEQIVILKSLVTSDDRSSSHSECSSHEENEEVKGGSFKTNLRKKKSQKIQRQQNNPE